MANKIAVLFRTHYWSDAIEYNYQLLMRNCSFETFILFDRTNLISSSLLDQYAGFSKGSFHNHTVQDFLSLGLYMHSNGLWHCGDYPLLGFFGKTNYQYALMIEADCHVNIDLDSVISSLADSRVDLAGVHLGANDTNWYWNQQYLIWLVSNHSQQTNAPSLRDLELQTVKNGGVFFPFIWMSRSLAEAQYNLRLQQSAYVRANPSVANWYPFCEKDILESCLATGHTFRPLQELIDCTNITWQNLFYSHDGLGKSVFHPALSGIDFCKKLQKIHRFRDIMSLSSYMRQHYDAAESRHLADSIIGFCEQPMIDV